MQRAIFVTGWLAAIAASAPAPGAIPAQAGQTPASPSACPVVPVPLPPGLEGWVAAEPVAAAATPDALPGARLVIGQRADVRLLPTPQVSYAAAPARSPGQAEGDATHGGLLVFTVQLAGAYRVALGSDAWIDLVRDGVPVTPRAHADGQPCSSIRATLDFALMPGRYVIQVADSASPTLALMVAHAP